MDPIALSTYYFVTLGVALLCCLLPSYARCQLQCREVSKEDQKIVHPNFNLGLSRQRIESKILFFYFRSHFRSNMLNSQNDVHG